MAKEPVEQFWKIEGFDSDSSIFEEVVPLAYFTKEQMAEILRRLASRHLEVEESFSASLPDTDARYAPHLELMISGPDAKRFSIATNGNPHYMAGIFPEDEL